MAVVVNIEGIKFSDLIHSILKNDHVKDCIEMDDGEIDIKEKENWIKNSHELFNELKNGKVCNRFILGCVLVDSLRELGRVLIESTQPEYDNNDPDYNIVPITKNKINKFLKKIGE